MIKQTLGSVNQEPTYTVQILYIRLKVSNIQQVRTVFTRLNATLE